MFNSNTVTKFHKPISILIILTWLSLILFLILDAQGLFGTDIGIQKTLESSSFARGMFADIGAISTFVSGIMLFCTKSKLRYLFAPLTLFIGSFAALPYFAYILWRLK